MTPHVYKSMEKLLLNQTEIARIETSIFSETNVNISQVLEYAMLLDRNYPARILKARTIPTLKRVARKNP